MDLPHRAAFNIAPLYQRNGDLQPRSGIHYALDAWLAALMRMGDEGGQWDMRAFAPLGIAARLQEQGASGAFAWWPAGSTEQTPPFLDTTGRRNAPPANPVLARVWARQGLMQAQTAARNYDLMHVLTPSFLPLSKYAPQHATLATIWDMTVRTYPETHTPENIAAWENYFAWIANSGANVVTISQAAKAEIVELLGIESGRVFVVPLAPRHGVAFVPDGPERDALLQTVGLAPATPFVLYAGTLEPRKNAARLIAAFAQVLHELPAENAPLLVLAGGTWAGYDQTLKQIAHAEGITNRVLFLGYVKGDVMNALMSACSVFAYPSLSEGFGMPPLEAMTCGAPVITSNVSSLPEVVGDAGVQVDPHDTNEIAAALHALLTDANENARRRTQSREQAAQFSWDETARQTLAIYDAVLSNGKGTRAS